MPSFNSSLQFKTNSSRTPSALLPPLSLPPLYKSSDSSPSIPLSPASYHDTTTLTAKSHPFLWPLPLSGGVLCILLHSKGGWTRFFQVTFWEVGTIGWLACSAFSPDYDNPLSYPAIHWSDGRVKYQKHFGCYSLFVYFSLHAIYWFYLFISYVSLHNVDGHSRSNCKRVPSHPGQVTIEWSCHKRPHATRPIIILFVNFGYLK